MSKSLIALESELSGELLFDNLIKSIYATDASVYRMLPLAVAYPKNRADIIHLINYAKINKVSLIPRTAGTSLAGNVWGKGLL